MSRWIDANEMIKVLAFFLDNMGITLFGRSGKDLASSLVFQADKGKDVVEVIRCRECKRRKKNGFCLEHNRYEKNDNGYCSYGERKESE